MHNESYAMKPKVDSKLLGLLFFSALFLVSINALDYFAGQHVVPRKARIVRGAFFAETRIAPVQFWALWILALYMAYKIPAMFRKWMTWKIPMPARIALTTIILVEVVHVVLQKDQFPFSNVGMYSPVLLVDKSTTTTNDQYFIKSEGTWEPFNLFREGNYLLSKHVYVGPKCASILKRNFDDPEAVEYLNNIVVGQGYPPLERGEITVNWSNLEVTLDGLGTP